MVGFKTHTVKVLQLKCKTLWLLHSSRYFLAGQTPLCKWLMLLSACCVHAAPVYGLCHKYCIDSRIGRRTCDSSSTAKLRQVVLLTVVTSELSSTPPWVFVKSRELGNAFLQEPGFAVLLTQPRWCGAMDGCPEQPHQQQLLFKLCFPQAPTGTAYLTVSA